jgi:hypothetical protein
MIAITIEYKPFGFFRRRKLNTGLPEQWSEMTPKQIAAIPRIQSGKIDDSKLLQIFLGIKRSIAKRVGSYQKYCILRNLKYIAKPEPVGTFKIKKIVGFKAPGDHLEGITFGAFIFGDTYYQNYIAGRKEDLNRFIACFYYSWLGFNDKKIERNARIIGLVDLSIREAIAINYALIREYLAKAYPYVFQKAEKNKLNKSQGWVAVFDRLVQNDFGNQDKYALFPVSTVLRHLNNLLKEQYKNGS